MEHFDIDQNVTIREAKSIFSRLMRAINQRDKMQFLSYIDREWLIHENSPDPHFCSKRSDVPDVIQTIINDITNRVPFNAILPSERIEAPKRGENSDCDPVATVHVDAFLYSDEDVNMLIDIGKLQNNYCADCRSRNIKPCIVISHSASYRSMEYVFHSLLPPLDGKTILDIGSRLGAVLYSAYVLSAAEKIIGVEMNADFCKLQTDIIQRHNLGNRIEVINRRIEECPEIVRASNVIIINNAFEFYVSEEVHAAIWKFLKDNMQRGTIFVTCPQIQQTLKELNTGIVIDDWVKPYTHGVQDAALEELTESLHFPDIGCYEVL